MMATLDATSDHTKGAVDVHTHLNAALQADSQPGKPTAAASLDQSARQGDTQTAKAEKAPAAGTCDFQHPYGDSPVKPGKVDQILPNLQLFDDHRNAIAGGTDSTTSLNARQQEIVKAAQGTLGNDNASSTEKLATVEALAKAGIKDLQIADKDGHMRDYSIETEKAGKNTMVHLYSKDDQGKEHIVLRGVDQNGTFKHEVNSKGEQVDFQGSHWAANEMAKTNVGVVTDDTHSAAPRRPTTPSDRQAPAGPGDRPLKPSGSPEAGTLPPNTALTSDQIISQHEAKATGYYPANNHMEGGSKDRKGNPLYTLQQYLAGEAPYVSVAMDHKAGIPYGQKVNIPEMNQAYGQNIPFRVVDTGSAFRGKGHSRIDICTANHSSSLRPEVNGRLTLQFVA